MTFSRPFFTFRYDLFNPAARAFAWAAMQKGYVDQYGLHHWWLDCDEPCGGTNNGSFATECMALLASRLNFHHFDRFQLDLRGHIHVRGAGFSCLRLKLADIVLI